MLIGVVPLILLLGIQLSEWRKVWNEFQYRTIGVCLILALVVLLAGNNGNVIRSWDRTTYAVELCDYFNTLDIDSVFFVDDPDTSIICKGIDSNHKYGAFITETQTLHQSFCSYKESTSGSFYEDNNTPLVGSYYVYTVKAYNSAGTPSDYIKANCASVQRVVAPVTKAANTSNGINVTWNKVAGANKYVILRRLGTNSTWVIIGETTGSSYLDKNVTAGTYYLYSIRAVNNTGYSEYDINKRATIQRLVAPKTTTSNELGGIKVSWNKVSGGTKYNVYRRQGGSSTWSLIAHRSTLAVSTCATFAPSSTLR